jgi:hypothetical protein
MHQAPTRAYEAKILFKQSAENTQTEPKVTIIQINKKAP